MISASELIEKAIAEAKAGNKAGAMKILAQAVRKEPGNAQAWLVLSRMVEEKEQIIYCLQQVLKIMPDSSQARARLKKLQATPIVKTPIPTQSKRKNRTGMVLLIGSAGVIELGFILVLSYLGIKALGLVTRPTPSTTFSQTLNQREPGSNPILASAEPSELKQTEPAPSFPTDTATFPPTPVPSPTPSSTSRPILSGAAACIPANAQIEAGNVTRVIDGDTIEVWMNGQTYRVRYIGIDSPETGTTPFGAEAAEKNRELVEGKEILLVRDNSETDVYGRLLRYAIAGDLSGVFVNYEMVASGYAQASSYPPDVACDEVFLSAENEARSKAYGLWAPIPIPTESNSVGDGGNCDPAYPEVCIPPPPPDLDCKDIPYKRFRVLPPDPHHFDRDEDGIGCEG